MTPIGSMGRLYIYLHENHRNELNVYTIHGSYGTGSLICDTSTIYIYIFICQVLQVENLVFYTSKQGESERSHLKKLVYDHICMSFEQENSIFKNVWCWEVFRYICAIYRGTIPTFNQPVFSPKASL